jgi:hypothetical protein
MSASTVRPARNTPMEMNEKSRLTGPDTVATRTNATSAKTVPIRMRAMRCGERDWVMRSQRTSANAAQSVAATSREKASTK